jgi:hypothetical protein
MIGRSAYVARSAIGDALSGAADDVSLVFACLAKDCEATVPNLFRSMDVLRAQGIRCAAVIGENGSQDNTRNVIIHAAERMGGSVTLVDTSFISGISNRLERMAVAREHLRNVLTIEHTNSRFICVADLDNVMAEPLESSSIAWALAELSVRPELFAISAISSPWYYDLLAYRSESLTFTGLEARFKVSAKNVLRYYAFHQAQIYPFQKQITRLGSHLCNSAFNGVCLYRRSEYIDGSYTRDADFGECEHITFNKSIAFGRQMLVSSNISLRQPTDHGPSSVSAFYWRRAVKRLKRITHRNFRNFRIAGFF